MCFHVGSSAPLSLMSMVRFGIALLVFGLPAAWYAQELQRNEQESSAATTKLLTLRTEVSAASRAIDKMLPRDDSRRAPDDLQRGMLRKMVADMEKQTAQHSHRRRRCGRVEGAREALRQKHRQRGRAGKSARRCRYGLNKILQDQGVSNSAAELCRRGKGAKEAELQRRNLVLAQRSARRDEQTAEDERSRSHRILRKARGEARSHEDAAAADGAAHGAARLECKIVQAPKQPPGKSTAAAESAKKRRSRAVAVKKLDLTGDGNAETVGYDTNGDESSTLSTMMVRPPVSHTGTPCLVTGLAIVASATDLALNSYSCWLAGMARSTRTCRRNQVGKPGCHPGRLARVPATAGAALMTGYVVR